MEKYQWICLFVLCSTLSFADGCEKTFGGTQSGEECCILPFTYQGIEYTKCTDTDSPQLWCYTKTGWGYCQVNGNWGAWGSWTGCSATCGGGTHTRIRYCDNPKPTGTGKLCTKADGTTGKDENVQQACNTQSCPVKTAQWGAWGTCTKACGSGTQQRSRTCSPGTTCVGGTAQTKSCNTDACAECSWASQRAIGGTTEGSVVHFGTESKDDCLSKCLWKRLTNGLISAVKYNTSKKKCHCVTSYNLWISVSPEYTSCQLQEGSGGFDFR